jgi:predicted DNA-binding transcriptional regulator YafY
MAKKKKNLANTQPQLTRLHGLVQRIQKGDYPSAKILAKEWEKSWSTIIRDLEFVRNSWHLPLAYDEKRYGFYFTEPIGKFPMVPISEQELVSVFVAQKALHQYRGTPFEAPLRSAFSKLVSSLQGELSVAWADLDAAISFRGIESDPKDMELLQRLGEAIRQRKEIAFIYHKLERTEENPKTQIPNLKSQKPPAERTADGGELRRVQPYHLACVGGQWYLFAYDLMRRDLRKFVPARMRKLQVKARRFQRPRNFDIDKLLQGSFGIFSGGKVVPLRIWFGRGRAQLIRERKWHQSQKIKELGNGEIELRLELSSFAEIVPWILSWGEHARALAPKALVDEVRETARRVVGSYP